MRPVLPDDLNVRQSPSEPDVYMIQLDATMVAISVGALHKLANSANKRIREREERRQAELDATHVTEPKSKAELQAAADVKPKKPTKKRLRNEIPAKVKHSHDHRTSGLKRRHTHAHEGGGEDHSHAEAEMRPSKAQGR